jgi:ferrous-iron efflux pump FieF
LFAACYLTVTAVGMLHAGLPDLLDRSVGEAVQLSILRALASHFDSFDHLHGIRTRRSGVQVFVQIALGFDADLALSEVDRRAAVIRETIGREIEGADISILLSAHPRQPAAG